MNGIAMISDVTASVDIGHIILNAHLSHGTEFVLIHLSTRGISTL
jgi:hypothetical protein